MQAAVIFFLAFTVRLVHIWQIRRAPFFTVLLGDARSYDDWAKRIAAGDWIGHDVFYQAPLYPYFIGLIYSILGPSVLAVRVCQALLGSVSCVLLGLTGQRLFSTRVGLIGGLALALYAPAIFFDGLIQKSVLDVFFLCLSLWLLSRLIEQPNRRGSWLFLGIAMGLLALTRENALVLVAVIIVWVLMRRASSPAAPAFSRVSAVGLFIFGFAIILGPIAVRNHAVGGGFYLTTSQFGPNLYIGNHLGADGSYASLRYGRGSPEYERQDATDLAEHALERHLTPSEVSSYWTNRALDFVTSAPGAWLKLMGRKFVLFWNATEVLDTESQETYAEWSVPLEIGGWIGHFGILVPLALFGVWITWPQRNRLWVLHALIAAYAASVLMFYVFARYRFPVVPLLILFAAAGLAALPDVVRTRRTREKIAAIAAAAAVAVFTNWPVMSTTLMRAITENNLAVALQDEGRLDEATAHYQRAIALEADYAPAYNNLGTAFKAKGNVDRAVATYERALQVQPDYPDAHYNLANALLEQNRPDEAASHFLAALKAIPGSVDVQNNLGIALASEGKLDEAVVQFEQALKIDPNSVKAYRNLGNVLSAQGHLDEGIEHLRRAAQIDPDDADAHYDLGLALLNRENYPEGAAELRRSLELNPDSPEAHNNLGVALGSQGHFDEAIEHFQQALKLNPDYPEARSNLDMTLKARRR